jgi:hypothetical protein
MSGACGLGTKRGGGPKGGKPGCGTSIPFMPAEPLQGGGQAGPQSSNMGPSTGWLHTSAFLRPMLPSRLISGRSHGLLMQPVPNPTPAAKAAAIHCLRDMICSFFAG